VRLPISCSDKDYILQRIDINPTTGCWVWRLSVNTNGYGDCTVRQVRCRAHRFAYRAWRGDPGAVDLDHLCRNRRCCNPDHLEPVSHLENMRRGEYRLREACPRGHAYTKDNLCADKRGWRKCLTCDRENQKRKRTRKSGGQDAHAD
jgi:HNH endonuclease